MDTTKKVKLAFLGVGGRGHGLMWEYSKHPQVEIVAVCDKADGRAQAVADGFNKERGTEVKAFLSYEELLKGPAFDALMIALDPDVQVDFAVDAMNRGIHVMTEVPAAFTIEQCHALVATVEKTGAKYQLAEQTRYWHFIRQFRAMAERGEFGKIIYAEGHYQHYEPVWDNFINVDNGHTVRSSDPALFCNPKLHLSWRGRCFRNPIFYLPHTLSPLLSITGGRIAKVACFGTQPLSYSTKGFPARDMQHAIMYNEDDVIFSVRASFATPHGYNPVGWAHWYQIKGTKAEIELPRSNLDTGKMFKYGEGWSEVPMSSSDPDAEEHIRTSGHGGIDFYPIDAFVRAIIDDTMPAMNVYKAVETAAPAILAANSCEQGGVMLEVPNFRKKL